MNPTKAQVDEATNQCVNALTRSAQLQGCFFEDDAGRAEDKRTALFDTVGRRKMIGGTFAISGVLLLFTALLFGAGCLSEITQTVAWLLIFFFASAAASSAYLTASEIFPLETRALAIACFYALGTAIGGSLSPLLFGWLIMQEGAAILARPT